MVGLSRRIGIPICAIEAVQFHEAVEGLPFINKIKLPTVVIPELVAIFKPPHEDCHALSIEQCGRLFLGKLVADIVNIFGVGKDRGTIYVAAHNIVFRTFPSEQRCEGFRMRLNRIFTGRGPLCDKGGPEHYGDVWSQRRTFAAIFQIDVKPDQRIGRDRDFWFHYLSNDPVLAAQANVRALTDFKGLAVFVQRPFGLNEASNADDSKKDGAERNYPIAFEETKYIAIPTAIPGILFLCAAVAVMFIGVGIACSQDSTALDFVCGLGIDLIGLWIAWYGWSFLFAALAH